MERNCLRGTWKERKAGAEKRRGENLKEVCCAIGMLHVASVQIHGWVEVQVIGALIQWPSDFS